MEDKNQVFVRIDDYKDVVDILNLAREKLEKAKDSLNKLNRIKSQEDAEMSNWAAELQDIEAKMTAIDSTLSRSGGM